MRLVTVAHGTRHPTGNDVARRITALAGRRLGVRAVSSYVELCEPSLPSALAASAEPAVVVPLLLTTGHHVRHDLPLLASAGTVLAGPLGPHPLLAEAQVSHLRAAGAARGQPVVRVAAGSRDPAARPGLEAAARLLADAWGGPVTLATLSGPRPRPADVVTPDQAVSPYLLAPGHFAARARRESAAAACVAGVIGAHPAVVELVALRFLAVAGEPASGPRVPQAAGR